MLQPPRRWYFMSSERERALFWPRARASAALLCSPHFDSAMRLISVVSGIVAEGGRSPSLPFLQLDDMRRQVRESS